MRTSVLSALLVLCVGCASTRGSLGSSHGDVAAAQAQFEKIKSLAGEWKGKGNHGDEPQSVEARYRVTAAGTAVEETLFPGTEHEMVTLYHLDGDRLMLTHYCAAGNQPRMVATADAGATIHFEFADATNLASSREGHMHELEMTVEGKDRLHTKWTFHRDGKPAEVAQFDLARKGAGS